MSEKLRSGSPAPLKCIKDLETSTYIYYSLLDLHISNLNQEVFGNNYHEKQAKEILEECLFKISSLGNKDLKLKLMKNILTDIKQDIFLKNEGDFGHKLKFLIEMVYFWMSRTKESFPYPLSKYVS